jgi:aminopeptidase-like protein
MRTPHGRFPEYHTSADDLDFVKPEFLADSFSKYLSTILVLEGNKKYLNASPKCEPQLGKRGLYRATGGQKEGTAYQHAMLWILNLSDGHHTLLDISERSGLGFEVIRNATDMLLQYQLLKEV